MKPRKQNNSDRGLARFGNFYRKMWAHVEAHFNGEQPTTASRRLYGDTFTNKHFSPRSKSDVSAIGAGDLDDTAEAQHAQTIIHASLFGPNALDATRVESNTPITALDGASAALVPEGGAIPLSGALFDPVTLRHRKIAALATITSEGKDKPDMRVMLQRLLQLRSVEGVDTAFWALPGANAASLLNNVTNFQPWNGSRSGFEGQLFDVASQMFDVILDRVVVLMHPFTKAGLLLSRNDLGLRIFPELLDGFLGSFRVLTSVGVPTSVAILVDGPQVYFSSAPTIIETSQNARLEFSDTPAADLKTPAGQTQKPCDLFGSDGLAIKVISPIDAQLRQPGAVGYISEISLANLATT